MVYIYVFCIQLPKSTSKFISFKSFFSQRHVFSTFKIFGINCFFVLFFYNYNVLKASFQVSLVNIEINCFFRNKKTLTQRNNSLFLLWILWLQPYAPWVPSCAGLITLPFLCIPNDTNHCHFERALAVVY